MKSFFMKYFYRSIVVGLIMLSANSCGKNDKKNEPQEQSVNIYLVALEGSNLSGKTIGCNDILVPISKNVLVEKSALESALNELLSIKKEGELLNFVKGPGLSLINVSIAEGIADIYLKGDFNISGACDIPRIHEQLNETAKQFPYLKKINIFINFQTLKEYLDIAKISF